MSNVESIQGIESASIEYSTSIGVVHELNSDGIPIVTVSGGSGEKLEADLGISAHEITLLKALPVKAVIVSSSDASERPVVTSIVRDRLTSKELDLIGSKKRISDVAIDGRQVTISGKDEMLFECGKSSILLRRDGKVVIKGTQVVSRASGSNKLKGSSVNIN